LIKSSWSTRKDKRSNGYGIRILFWDQKENKKNGMNILKDMIVMFTILKGLNGNRI